MANKKATKTPPPAAPVPAVSVPPIAPGVSVTPLAPAAEAPSEKSYEVLTPFMGQATGRVMNTGEEYTPASEREAQELLKLGLIGGQAKSVSPKENK